MDDKFKTQYPTRKVQVHTTPNGEPFAYSMTSSKHVKVIAEVQAPPQLPGLVIFVHGMMTACKSCLKNRNSTRTMECYQ